VFGTPGPWPLTNVTYGGANGVKEAPIVGASTDETQNLWVATHSALYLLQPGQATFHRFSATDGLHLQSNPVAYCDLDFGDHACPIYGAAADPGITEIVGGGPNEVFVGYQGKDEGTADWTDPNRHSGKLDRVRLLANGTLQVDRFDLVQGVSAAYWHNRTIQRMVFDHFRHPHELYVGTNHGVDLIRPDQFRYPKPNEWFNDVNHEWLSDHIHPEVCVPNCAVPPALKQPRYGDWRGLALSPDGDLWVAGRWTAGKVRWTADLFTWSSRNGEQTFSVAFGDPYPVPPNAQNFINEPVFRPPKEGDPVSLSAVSVAPDGRVWFASGSYYGGTDQDYGVAVWNGQSFQVFDPVTSLGMEKNVRDLIALPDGRIVLAGPRTGLLLWNPATGSRQTLRAPAWLPDDNVQRLELDTMVSPPALHVSTETGATVIRQLP
jgi:WD40 repeat protein